MSFDDVIKKLCEEKSLANHDAFVAGKAFSEKLQILPIMESIASILNTGYNSLDYSHVIKPTKYLVDKMREEAHKVSPNGACYAGTNKEWNVYSYYEGKYFEIYIQSSNCGRPTVVFSILADAQNIYFKFSKYIKTIAQSTLNDSSEDFITTQIITFLFDCFDQI